MGGKEKSTLKEISESLGKETIDSFNTSTNRGQSESYGMNYQKLGKELKSQDELAVMDGGKCILQVRGVRPFFSDKFDITRHKQYPMLLDDNPEMGFNIEKYVSDQKAMRLRLSQQEKFTGYGVDMTAAGQEVTTVSATETETADTQNSEETEQRDNRLKLRTFFTLFFEGDFLPMNELNISAVDATAMETATTTSAPKHKWLSKLTRGAKKATMFCTVAGIMASTCATQAFAAGTGEVDTSSFITTACTVLKSVICLIGGGVSLWGVVNLLEGYGNDNPGAKSQGMKQLMAGLGLILLAIILVPVLEGMMTGAV